MSYLRNSSNTFQKCQKILTMFQQIGYQKNNIKNHSRPNSAVKDRSGLYYLTQSTTKKSTSKSNLLKNSHGSQSALKDVTKTFNQSISKNFNRNTESSLFRQKSNSSFVSSYKKQSRLDQIMKLKVNRPSVQSIKVIKANKKSQILNTSINSLNSSRSSLNKENNSSALNKMSRLQKIMNIKVKKPNINSTLVGYEPRKGDRSQSRSLSKKNSFVAQNSAILELKDCKKRIRKSQQLQQKQQRLWRLFQRQRQQQQKQKKRKQQSVYKQQRRKQQKFQKLVQKQLRKIQNSRQVSLRKQKIFSNYVYPAY